jgi:hypothetical protein
MVGQRQATKGKHNTMMPAWLPSTSTYTGDCVHKQSKNS